MDDKFYDTEYTKDNTIYFRTGQTEMMRVSPEGFWIRGVKVEQGPGEAEAVYNAIKQIIVWDVLQR